MNVPEQYTLLYIYKEMTMYNFEELLQQVNDSISKVVDNKQPEGLYAPIRYALSLGGKRLRPVLTLMAYNLYREDIECALMPALGVEVYHNFTLLHDDLMDRAEVRRSMPCVHKKWDDNTAVLSGDHMLVLAFRQMSMCDSEKLPAVLRLFTQTAAEIDEGQQYDVDFETRDDVTEQEYIEMIRLKTSVLLACALEMGAILASAPEADRRLLYEFGEKLGLAFQLQDDYLDVYGDSRVFGKKIGGDILCNKKTYMLINALRNASATQRAELEGWLKAEDYNPEEKVAAVTSLYTQIGVDKMALRKIDEYFLQAEKCLDALALPEEKKVVLRSLSARLLNRKS